MPSTRRMSVKKRNPSRLARRLRSAQRFSNVGPCRPEPEAVRSDISFALELAIGEDRGATSLMMSAFARVTMGTRATVRRIARIATGSGAPRMQEEKDAADLVRSEVWCRVRIS